MDLTTVQSLDVYTWSGATSNGSDFMNFSLAQVTEEDISTDLYILLYRYVAPLIFALGLVGNTLTLVVLDAKRSTTNAFLVSIAVADLSLLVLLLPPIWVNTVFKWQLMTKSALCCRLLKVLMYTSGDVGVWLLTIFSIDRAIAIYSPLTRRTLCSSYSKVYLLALVTVLVLVCKNIHMFWTTGNIIQGDHYSYCGAMPRYRYFENEVRPYLMLTVVVLLPFSCMLTSNVVIVTVLKRSHIRRHHGGYKKRAGEMQFKQTIITCLLVSFAFFILMIPGFILAAIRPQWSHRPSYRRYGEVAEAINVLLAATNHSVNFYLYCLSGRAFRRDLRRWWFSCSTAMTTRTDRNGRTCTETRRLSHDTGNTPPVNVYHVPVVGDGGAARGGRDVDNELKRISREGLSTTF